MRITRGDRVSWLGAVACLPSGCVAGDAPPGEGRQAWLQAVHALRLPAGLPAFQRHLRLLLTACLLPSLLLQGELRVFVKGEA